MNSLIKLIFLFAILSLSGCQSNSATNDSLAVFDLYGNQLVLVNDQKLMTEIVANFKAKKEVMVKQLPNFQYHLTLIDKGKITQWQYAQSGYLRAIKSSDDTIYFASNSLLNQVISNSTK